MRDSSSPDPVDAVAANQAAPPDLLVVDDEAEQREVMRKILEEEGYHVATAIHGRDALAQLLAGAHPGLILLDLRMPEMDAWAFMAELKARPELAAIPVVVTSAAGGEVLSSAPVSAGYLAKPLDRAQLLQTVEACLWRTRHRREPGPDAAPET